MWNQSFINTRASKPSDFHNNFRLVGRTNTKHDTMKNKFEPHSSWREVDTNGSPWLKNLKSSWLYVTLHAISSIMVMTQARYYSTVAECHDARIIKISLCFRQTMYRVQLNKEACQRMCKQKPCHAVSYRTVVCEISHLCRVKWYVTFYRKTCLIEHFNLGKRRLKRF